MTYDSGSSRELVDSDAVSADIVILGTGMGGGTLAYALRDRGATVLLLERGGFLPQEPGNWMPEVAFHQQRYKATERWLDGTGQEFRPGVHYFVGGNTKMFGAALERRRQANFEAVEHEDGVTPAWPIRYGDLEPYYVQAEKLYRAHGRAGEDPTEPPRSADYPYPALEHERPIAELAQRLRTQGLHPFQLPMGVDWRDGGRCIRCKTCDGFPCQVLAKSDADVCSVRPALSGASVRLSTHTYARRLLTEPSGRRVRAVEVDRNGQRVEIRGGTFVVSCGAVNSAALLLRSANSTHPDGLANSSGLVGRNYMHHNCSALMAVHPVRRNRTSFQKTLAVNDFYLADGERPPLGNLQLVGKLQAGMLTAEKRLVPRRILQGMADRSIDWWLMSEDLPRHENQIRVTSNGNIQVRWIPNNVRAHRELVAACARMMRRAGYPLILTKRFGIETNSHQCGTLRFGEDPAASVLDPLCKTHDLENLYVVDSSFFPSSAAVGPSLTIAAQALRVADKAGLG